MSKAGKVKVVVRSRKVPVGTVELVLPLVSHYGLRQGGEKGRFVLYEDVLDEDHQRAIRDGRRLADQLGLVLEVVDASRSNRFRRALSPLSWGSRSNAPKLLVATSYQPASAGARGDSCSPAVPR